MLSTGHFIMFSVITNIYNKQTKGPTLMELFTATGKLERYFFTTRNVRCIHHEWHGTHRYDIQVLATHASTWMHRYSSLLQWLLSCKKTFFSFPVAVNNSIKVGNLPFLVINVCNHGERYETSCICGCIMYRSDPTGVWLRSRMIQFREEVKASVSYLRWQQGDPTST
jgi:hypothetical protein